MTDVRTVTVEGTPYCVVISDEAETLLAARAAGRVPVGLWKKNSDLEELAGVGTSVSDGVGNLAPARTADFSMVKYVVETLDRVDERFLERVVRRELGLPWMIAESDRLLLREFDVDDWKKIPEEPQDVEADRIFYDKDKLEAYIRQQYGFYEYGVWAVVRKEDAAIVGKAGIVGADETLPGMESGTESSLMMELGYHIFSPYRRQGYALETCRMILDYIHEEFEAQAYAVTKTSNKASRGVLEKLGFAACRADGDGLEVMYRDISIQK
ncbi:MAG: GNAT family N-acetyltransferase [Brotaphodocola sp.]